MAAQSDTQLPPTGTAEHESRANGSDDSVDSNEEKQQHRDEENQVDAPAPQDEPEEKAPAGPGPPPDGGALAWAQVVGAWMLFFNTWGLLNTFGIFQTYYESGALWTASSSNIAWIGSVQAVCVLIGGSFAGPIFDRGYLRALLLSGSFLVVFGHMMLSLTTTFWQAVLAQGFCIGLGAGCLFIPSVAIMPTYFSKNLGLAIGLAASGSSTGGIIYPIMFYKLIDPLGYPWTVRVLGFTAMATLIVPNVVMKMRFKPPKVRAIIDWSAFTDFPYMLFVFGAIIGFIGLYVAIFYTSFYGEATGYTDARLSFYLVPILNAGSVLGRTFPNWLSDKIGPFNVIAPGAICVGIILFCYLAVSNAGGMIVVTLLFGFFSGIFIAMPPVLFVALTKDKSKIGTRIGMGFSMLAIGVLCGGPAGGAILGQGGSNGMTGLHWTSTWVYAGVTSLASGVVFCIMRFMRGGFKLKIKV